MTKTYFISGHLDISPEEFRTHYKPKIDSALAEGAKFVVGDARGLDTLAQSYLKGKTTQVTVYHMKKKAFNNLGNFETKGGFKTNDDKDSAMTRDSDEDIAWVRPAEDQKKLYGAKYRKRVSGTEKNLTRRRKQTA